MIKDNGWDVVAAWLLLTLPAGLHPHPVFCIRISRCSRHPPPPPPRCFGYLYYSDFGSRGVFVWADTSRDRQHGGGEGGGQGSRHGVPPDTIISRYPMFLFSSTTSRARALPAFLYIFVKQRVELYSVISPLNRQHNYYATAGDFFFLFFFCDMSFVRFFFSKTTLHFARPPLFFPLVKPSVHGPKSKPY